MSADRVELFLNDIRHEISGIRDLTAGASSTVIANNWAMRRATEHALLIIAEAARHDLKATRPEVPWRKIHGLGNLLRHEYRHIDADILWSVIAEHLEPLDAAIKALLDRRQIGGYR